MEKLKKGPRATPKQPQVDPQKAVLSSTDDLNVIDLTDPRLFIDVSEFINESDPRH